MFFRRAPASKRDATAPIQFHSPTASWFGGGIGGPSQPDHQTLLRESSGFNATAARAIANRLASLNPQVKIKRRVEDGTQVDEVLDDHPLKRLLDRPHPNMSRSQLLRLTAQWIVEVGESYYLKVANRLRVPVELHPIPPTMISPVLSGGVVTGYAVQDGHGRQQVLPADVVVRCYFPDPEDPWRSEGYLAPSGVYADTLKFSGEHLRRHFQRDATPKTVLQAQAGAQGFTKEAIEALAVEWRKAYDVRSGDRVGLPAVTPPLYELVQMAMQSGAEIVPLLEFLRDEQLMAHFTPRSVLGQVVSGDRSSAEVNQWVFDRYAVLPVAQLVQESLTLQLARDFDESLFVEFEPFVSEDKEFALKAEAHDLEHAVRTINEVRRGRGDDPVPWGEKPTMASKIGAYDPNAKPAAKQPQAGADEEADGAEDADGTDRSEQRAHAAIRKLARSRRVA